MPVIEVVQAKGFSTPSLHVRFDNMDHGFCGGNIWQSGRNERVAVSLARLTRVCSRFLSPKINLQPKGRGDWTVPEQNEAAGQVMQQMADFFTTLANKEE